MVFQLRTRFQALLVVAAWLLAAGCGSTAATGAAGFVSDIATDSSSIDLHFGRDPDADAKVDAALDVLPSLADSEDAESAPDTDGVNVGGDVTETCTGAAGCPCKENAECDSTMCIATPGGTQCAQTCSDVCPSGYKCSAVTAAGGDISTICLPRWGALCNPCATTSDCATLGVAGAACVDQGAAGRFCGAACSSDGDCPSGHSCLAVTSAEGKSVQQCQPATGECTCSAAAEAAQLVTACSVLSKDLDGKVIGTCKGVRSCGPAGLSACSATPMAETCNGLDDDCNGQTDEGSCEDNNACTLDVCDGKACSHAPTPGACNADNNACTVGDSCQDGVCKPGAFKTCDDGNPCTLDVCDPAKGCTQTNDDGVGCSDGDACTTGDVCQAGACKGSAKDCGAGSSCASAACDPSSGSCVTSPKADNLPCDDGSACTVGDACKGGSCSGGLVACDDGNGCTLDTCDAKLGCQHSASTLPCDDGNACTQGDVCKDNACAGKAVDVALACDDGQVCTADVCDTVLGCTHIANSAACDDGNACTVGDACDNKACVPGANTCQCGKDADCAAFDDNNLCNGTLFCDKSSLPYACKTNPATVVTCSTDTDTTCSHTQCDTTTGKCGAISAPDTKPCDADGNPCTVGDACQGGVCTAGFALLCNDGNVCTDDACVGGSCVYTANAAPCDADGNACTQNDTCTAKNCVAGPQKQCDDSNPCTADSCDAVGGQCVHDGDITKGKPCDADGSVCTKGDACDAGACKPGATLNCDDANTCTDDACSALTGCSHTANDGPCNADDNACTQNDACEAKVCVAGPMKICDDGVLCTADSCIAATGACSYDAVGANGKACSDGSVCTTNDACLGGVCTPGSALPCDDANVCTNDGCSPLIGCTHGANTAPCDADGNACTENDYCSGKTCFAGTMKVCNDGVLCTIDSCSPLSGLCHFDTAGADGLACSDGSVCTTNDACLNGSCKPGAALPCDDKNVCTNDTCDSSAGCQHSNNSAACDADGNACTQNDTCADGGCVTGAMKVCNDNQVCTTDSCNAVSGACVFTPVAAGTACDADGSVCTVNDACAGGVCVPGATKNCDDSNPCTTDSCDMAAGCTSTAVADGTACPGSQFCTGGKCGYGTPVVPTKKGDLLISEIMANPDVASGDVGGEWFEVYNPGPVPILIDQMKLVGMTDWYLIVQPGLAINPGQYFTFGTSTAGAGFKPDFIYAQGTAAGQMTLGNNSSDKIELNYKGLILDSAAWSSTTAGHSVQYIPPDFINDCPGITQIFCLTPTSSTCDYGTPGAPTVCM